MIYDNFPWNKAISDFHRVLIIKVDILEKVRANRFTGSRSNIDFSKCYFHNKDLPNDQRIFVFDLFCYVL